MKKIIKLVFVFVPIMSLSTTAIDAFVKEQSVNKKFVLESNYKENNTYTLEVYRQTGNNSFTGLSSSAGFAQAYVVLKDKQGKVLLEPKWYASCDFIIGDLDVRWSVNRVYFTKFNYIDLTSMSFDCY